MDPCLCQTLNERQLKIVEVFEFIWKIWHWGNKYSCRIPSSFCQLEASLQNRKDIAPNQCKLPRVQAGNHRRWLPTRFKKLSCVDNIITSARCNSSSLHALSTMYPGVKSVVWWSDAIPLVSLDARRARSAMCPEWRNTTGRPGWEYWCVGNILLNDR
jgi:hypothetical protein